MKTHLLVRGRRDLLHLKHLAREEVDSREEDDGDFIAELGSDVSCFEVAERGCQLGFAPP